MLTLLISSEVGSECVYFDNILREIKSITQPHDVACTKRIQIIRGLFIILVYA